MCGICGIVHFNNQPIEKSSIQAMTNALIHRGPDDEGYTFFPNQNPVTAFGFRRLSIIDLAGGHQPMTYQKNTIVFNGEIYNFQELKKECESLGHRFQTQSDTEVILHLYDQYGEKCLEKLNGMFAFAIWNEEKKELFLARDRIGIKPLYYFFNGQQCAFASEMKSLVRSGKIPLEFDPSALMDFFSFRFVSGPFTVLKDVKKVLPGHFIRIRQGDISEMCYWDARLNSPSPQWDRGEVRGGLKSFQNYESELSNLLEDSVRLQMISDVPLGSFLSGGVDSSLITALMAKNSKNKIKTFSIGFEKSTGVDESAYARKAAQFIGTEHHELILTEKDLSHTDQIFSTMNEPVADPTILPTAILSGFARKHVKVVLTGEGGDELFAGYNRYKAVLYAQWVKQFPSLLQPLASAIFRKSGRGECFQAIPDVGAHNWFELNRDFPKKMVGELFLGYPAVFTRPLRNDPSNDPVNAVLDLELRTSLVDRLLMKVDMASMGQSLEARPPYLDHRIVELAFQIPSHYKIRWFKGKYILRKIAEKFLPKELCWRRKHGFIVPITKWMQVNSKARLDALLEDSFLETTGIFNHKHIQKLKEKIYNNGHAETIALLWPAIVLNCWFRSLKNGS